MRILMTLWNRHVASKPLYRGLLPAIHFGWANLAQRWQASHSVLWTNGQKRQITLGIHILCLPPSRRLASTVCQILLLQLTLQLFLFFHYSRQGAPVPLFVLITSLSQRFRRHLKLPPPGGVAIEGDLWSEGVLDWLLSILAEIGGFANQSTLYSGQGALKVRIQVIFIH